MTPSTFLPINVMLQDRASMEQSLDAAVETAKAVTVAAQTSPQQEVLQQTIEGQLRNTEISHQKELVKSAIEPAKLLPSARKGLS